MTTLAVLTYPHIDPVLVTLGPLQVRWYGLAYVAGFVVAALVMRELSKRWEIGLTDDEMITAVLYAVIGLMVGARLGYVIGYGAGAYFDDPLSILRVWDGGMSFHGGFVGIVLAGMVFARQVKVPFLRVADMAAVGTTWGLFFGRVANFINGELWGRPSDLPWAMVFPGAGPTPRHPSQLYEAGLEGLVLFTVLWVMARRKRPEGMVSGTFIGLYGVFRFAVEFARQPDVQLGYVLGPFTMGQLLSVPLIVIGAWIVWRAWHLGKADATVPDHQQRKPD